MCARDGQTDRHWTLGEDGGSRYRRERGVRGHRERGVEGKQLIQGAFLLNSTPRKLCTRAPRFLLLEPEGKARLGVGYRENRWRRCWRAGRHPSRPARIHLLRASLGAAGTVPSLWIGSETPFGFQCNVFFPTVGCRSCHVTLRSLCDGGQDLARRSRGLGCLLPPGGHLPRGAQGPSRLQPAGREPLLVSLPCGCPDSNHEHLLGASALPAQ